MAPRKAFQIGARTVLAMTCLMCGKLKDGSEFPRYRRSAQDRMHYQSRRCRKCWWDRMDRSLGKSRGYNGVGSKRDRPADVLTN